MHQVMKKRANSSGSFIPAPELIWKQAMGTKAYSKWLVAVLVYLVGMVVFLDHFLPFIDKRHGVILRDPLLAVMPPRDLSHWIFSVIYLSLFISIAYLVTKPGLLVQGLLTLAVVYTLRVLTLYMIPLEPPAGCVPLRDPFVLHLAYGGVMVTRDLFFSGHTACLLTMVLVVHKKTLRILLSLALVAVMVMLLFQHAHYTIDILGALVLTPLCWIACRRLFPGISVPSPLAIDIKPGTGPEP